MTDSPQETSEGMVVETKIVDSDSVEKPLKPGSAGKRKRVESPSDEGPASKHHEAERRKSQRRSSFVRGRISIQLPAKHRGERDFTQEIDPNLPSDERLARLYSSALEFSLEKVCMEFEELDGMQQFRIEGREKGCEVVEKLQEAGAFKEATTLKKGLSNPVNIEIEEGITTLEAYRNRLKKECEDWDRILQERSRLSDETVSKASSEEGKIIQDPPRTLTMEQKAFLESAPNYDSIQEFLKKVRTEVDLFNTELKKKCELVTKCEERAKEIVTNQAKLIGDLTTDSNVKLKTPRTLLTEFTAS